MAEQSHTIASIMSGEDPNPLKKKIVESLKRINTMIVNSCEGCSSRSSVIEYLCKIAYNI